MRPSNVDARASDTTDSSPSSSPTKRSTPGRRPRNFVALQCRRGTEISYVSIDNFNGVYVATAICWSGAAATSSFPQDMREKINARRGGFVLGLDEFHLPLHRTPHYECTRSSKRKRGGIRGCSKRAEFTGS
jgi:hypothetical protein